MPPSSLLGTSVTGQDTTSPSSQYLLLKSTIEHLREHDISVAFGDVSAGGPPEGNDVQMQQALAVRDNKGK